MSNKVIVVYVAESYVAQEDQEPNENELVTYLNPIISKTLDFRAAKTVNAMVSEIAMEIQDSYFQIFRPAKQELEYTQTRVSNEDYQSRNYLEMEYSSYGPTVVNTRDPILLVNFNLDTTLTVQERTAYDSLVLFGDIGGLGDFLYAIITPLVALAVGNRYTYSLLASLFWVNHSNSEES